MTDPAGRTPLPSPAEQLARLDAVPGIDADFAARAHAALGGPLRAGAVEILQLNLGKLCNMTCRHCHVDAGPWRTEENMDAATVDACLAAIDRLGASVVDLTGGAPELHPQFRRIVDACVARGVHVIDRCNLSVLLLHRCADLPEWLGERGVEVVASLPHWRRPATDAQRGDGAWDASMEALKRLNAAGYGKGDPKRRLTLVHNPAGAFLAADQRALERDWRAGLERTTGVTFDRLIALQNMPIARFLDWLGESGNVEPYLGRLVGAFNPATLGGVMCRNTLSVGWDGRVYDCDFNQMLALEADVPRPHIDEVTSGALVGRVVRTARHCFGCTAGAGSSCGGALAT